MEEIFFKELTSQELTGAEKRKLEFWLNENPKNQKIYAQFKLTAFYPKSPRSEDIKEKTWDELLTQLKFDKTKTIVRKHRWWRWLQVAAMLIVVGAILFIAFEVSTLESQIIERKLIEKVSLPGQKITTELPDGTEVKLNAGSRIIFPESFSEGKREVVLKGEAYFDVVEDPGRPFIIKTSAFNVLASDASLNVNAIQEARKWGVAVESGNVIVIDPENQKTIKLDPEEKIVVREDEFKKAEIVYQDLYFGWANQLMVFKDYTFPEVMRAIKRWYDVDIELAKEINSEKTFTAKYKEPELQRVLRNLAQVYNFKYSIDGKIITIK